MQPRLGGGHIGATAQQLGGRAGAMAGGSCGRAAGASSAAISASGTWPVSTASRCWATAICACSAGMRERVASSCAWARARSNSVPLPCASRSCTRRSVSC
jgi:hypothetical protein